MKDLKIRVDNDAESRKVQELFFELGYTWSGDSKDIFDFDMPEYIVSWNNGYITVGDDFDKNRQEITLPELRDLVVLKRNDVGDATHEHKYDGSRYLSLSNVWYWFDGENWVKSEGIIVTGLLKPIEKPMKEYLRKNNDGEYILEVTNEREAQEPHAKHWIEVPSGMNIYWKEDGDYWFTTQVMGYRGAKIIWQRHTLPEELPFIDDEPLQSLNDQYAEIEKVRQDIINSPIHYADSTIECIDAMEAMMTPEQFIGYLRGNVFKYQWRYEKKNGIEDLKKAQWYLERLTEKVAEKNAPF